MAGLSKRISTSQSDSECSSPRALDPYNHTLHPFGINVRTLSPKLLSLTFLPFVCLLTVICCKSNIFLSKSKEFCQQIDVVSQMWFSDGEENLLQYNHLNRISKFISSVKTYEKGAVWCVMAFVSCAFLRLCAVTADRLFLSLVNADQRLFYGAQTLCMPLVLMCKYLVFSGKWYLYLFWDLTFLQ